MATLFPRHLGAVLLTDNHHCFCTNIYFTDLPMQLSFTKAMSHSTPIMYTTPPPTVLVTESSLNCNAQKRLQEVRAQTPSTKPAAFAARPKQKVPYQCCTPSFPPAKFCTARQKKDAMTGQGGTTYLLQVVFLSPPCVDKLRAEYAAKPHKQQV